MTTRSSWIWGLIAAAVLLGGGMLLGHLLSTPSEAATQRWADSTEVLLGEARRRHLAVADSFQRMADSLAARAAAAADLARAEQANRAGAARVAAALARTTDSLRGVLDSARSAGDSIPVLTALVMSLTEERDSVRAVAQRDSTAAAQQASAYADQMAASAALQARITADSTRLVVLEGQLDRAPIRKRWRLRLGPFDVHPACLTYRVTGSEELALGPTACLSP